MHCELLDLLPARVGSGYPTVPATTRLPSTSVFPWGGAVVQQLPQPPRPPLYHGFFAEYLNHCPMTYGTWYLLRATKYHVS